MHLDWMGASDRACLEPASSGGLPSRARTSGCWKLSVPVTFSSSCFRSCEWESRSQPGRNLLGSLVRAWECRWTCGPGQVHDFMEPTASLILSGSLPLYPLSLPFFFGIILRDSSQKRDRPPLKCKFQFVVNGRMRL